MQLTLSPDELREITGYIQPAAQLRTLLEQGFTRARRDRLGRVVLTREHYDAVEASRTVPAANGPALHMPRPRLHLA